MQANEAPQERMSAAWRLHKRGYEPRRGSVMVKTIDATTTDRLRRSPLYLDLSPSCARKRACMELTTICRLQRLLNPSFRLFQCFQSIASLPYKIVWEILHNLLTRNHVIIKVFRLETASGFYPWGNVVSPRTSVAEGLCGWRHGNSFPMTQSAQSHRQMRSIPHCSKAVFYVFVFESIDDSATMKNLSLGIFH